MLSKEETVRETALLSVFSHSIMVVIKLVAGIVGLSFALVADALESFADLIASIFMFFGLKYSSKPPDEDHPYGHGRIEPLITFLIVIMMNLSAGFIFFQSIKNIRTPHESPLPFTLLVLAAIIIWKEISFRYVDRKGKEMNSTTLRAEAWHHRSDALTSVAAFIGISIAIWQGPGYESSDDWAALIAAVIMVYNSYKIFRPAWGEIMDEHLHDDLIFGIRSIAAEVTDIRGTEKCYVRKIGMYYGVELHAMVDATLSVKEGHDIGHRLQDRLKEAFPDISYVLVHIEPDE